MARKIGIVLIGLLITAFIAVGLIACRDGGGGGGGGEISVFAYNDGLEVVIEVHVKGLAGPEYDIDAEPGMELKLHSKKFNNENNGQYDIVDESTIDNDLWIVFRIPNWAFYGDEGETDRMWGSCEINGITYWMYIPRDGNAFYREDCHFKPGLEMAFYTYQNPTPVPEGTPIDCPPEE